MSNLKRWFAFAACALAGLSVFAKDLVWNGGPGDAWTLSSPVWLDGSTPCAWENGATAVFSGSGLVSVSDEVEAAGIRFTTSGTMLVGSGLIRLSGALDVAEGTENAMAVRLYGAPSMSKTGAGTVALAYTRGALAIEAGKVYAGGFNMRDTAVTVAPDAELKLVTPTGRDKSANLLSNASFETPSVGNSYKYVGVNELSPWKRGSANYIVLSSASAQKNTWGNELATVPDGNQIAAVQINGELTQTVTVPADGYYDLSFYMFRRGGKTAYGPHQLYISVDGAFLTPMFDIFWSGLPQFVDTGVVYLKAGSHSLTIAGEGFWGDTTTFIDDLVFAPAVLTNATAIPASSGTVVDVATGEQTFDGTYTLTADDHGICHITKTGAGKAVFTQNVNVPGWTVYDVEGEAEYAGTLTGAKNLYKRGAGSLTLTTPGACIFKIQNGDLRVKNYTGSMSVSYLVDQGATAGFYPGLGSGDASLGDMLFQGGGACLIGTLGDGRTLTVSGAQLYAPRAVFDVGAGDTIKLGDLRAYLVGNRKDYVDTDAVKLGPGTLELTTKPSCYPPTTFTVRAGTLVADFSDEPWNLSYTRTEGGPVSVDVCGLMRGASTPLVLGDGGSPTDAAIVFAPNYAAFKSGRPIVAHARPASVAIDVRSGSATFTGKLTVNRADLGLNGAAGTTLALGDIEKGAEVASATLVQGADVSLALNGTVGAGIGLTAAAAHDLNLGKDAVATATFDTVDFTGGVTIDFGADGNDVLTADTLKLGAVAFTLNDLFAGGDFARPGRFVLARYTTFDGDVATLSVANAIAGYTYTFTAANDELALTIATEESNPVYTWTGVSGGWADAANWDHTAPPNAADKTVVFPRTATAANEVTLAGSLTAGAFVFENAAGVTLSGNGALTLDAEEPLVRVLSGTATLNVGLSSAKAVRVLTGPGAKLVLNGSVACDLRVSDAAAVSFGSESQVSGRVIVESASALDLANGGTVTDAGIKGLVGKFWHPADWTTTGRNTIRDWRAYKAWAEGGTFITRKLMDNADGFLVDDVTAKNLPTEVSAGPDADHWVGIWEGTMTVPASGVYGFKAACDDDFVLAIDGVNVTQTRSNVAAPAFVTLAAGPHRIFLGLTDDSSYAKLDVTVRTPDGTVQRLPLSWLTPDMEISALSGSGTLAPGEGSALAVRQQTGFSAWTGTVNGDGAVTKFGTGELTTGLAGGSVLAAEGSVAVADAATATTVGALPGARAILTAGGTAAALVGAGEVVANGAYAMPVTGDADCGISSTKKYTHLINWTTAAYNEPVNGVTFDLSGGYPKDKAEGIADVLAEKDNPGVQPQAGDTTPYRKMMRKLGLGNAKTNTLTIKGLTAGKRYDFRFYLRPFGTSDRKFTHNFIVGGKVVGSVVWDPDHDAGNLPSNDAKIIDPMSIVGCRYTADASGQLVLQTVKYTKGDTNGFHYYAVSNEELSDADESSLTLASDGEGVFDGDVKGLAVAVGGTGTQTFRGTLDGPLEVLGNVVLDGAAATDAAHVAAGGRLALRPGASVGALTGEGEVQLVHGEASSSLGEPQADGTFAAPAYPRRVFFSGDADCGISSAKRYAHAWNFNAPDKTWPTVVNGAQLAAVASDVQFDARRMVHLSYPGGGASGTEPSWSAEFKASEVYQLLKGMVYTGGFSDIKFVIQDLVVGREYEIRMYNRQWETRARQCIYRCDPYGDGKTVEFDFNENDVKEPSYVAIRICPTNSTFNLIAATKQTKDAPHFYAATVEEVADYSRKLAAATDATFDGTVTGNGAVRKVGAGVQTLAGVVTSTGPWTVSEGGLLFANAASTIADVAVESGASFGGTCTVTGNVGVVSGGTLDAARGVLDLRGKTVFADGAKIAIACDKDGAGCIKLADATLPANLTIDFRAASAGAKLPYAAKILELPASFDGDVSAWQATGSLKGIRNLQFSRSGNAVMAMRSGFSVIVK